MRLAMFGAMGAMLVASLAVPDVFGDDAFLFACAYAVVRIAHLVLYAVAGRGDRDLLAAVARLAVGSAIGVVLLFVAAALDGPLQVAVWAIALACDLLGAYIGGGTRLAARAGPLRRAARADRDHRARRVDRRARRSARRRDLERGRHRGGCSSGSRSRPRSGGRTSTSSRSSPSAGCARRTGNAQLTMARDSYSYLHLPMVAGIILFAVGVKKTLGDVGEPLKLVPAVALCGGVAMYLVAHVLFRLRNVRSLNRPRGSSSPRSCSRSSRPPSSCRRSRRSAIVAALCVGLIAYEAIRYAEARDRVRHAPEPASSAG